MGRSRIDSVDPSRAGPNPFVRAFLDTGAEPFSLVQGKPSPEYTPARLSKAGRAKEPTPVALVGVLGKQSHVLCWAGDLLDYEIDAIGTSEALDMTGEPDGLYICEAWWESHKDWETGIDEGEIGFQSRPVTEDEAEAFSGGGIDELQGHWDYDFRTWAYWWPCTHCGLREDEHREVEECDDSQPTGFLTMEPIRKRVCDGEAIARHRTDPHSSLPEAPPEQEATQVPPESPPPDLL